MQHRRLSERPHPPERGDVEPVVLGGEAEMELVVLHVEALEPDVDGAVKDCDEREPEKVGRGPELAQSLPRLLDHDLLSARPYTGAAARLTHKEDCVKDIDEKDGHPHTNCHLRRQKRAQKRDHRRRREKQPKQQSKRRPAPRRTHAVRDVRERDGERLYDPRQPLHVPVEPQVGPAPALVEVEDDDRARHERLPQHQERAPAKHVRRAPRQRNAEKADQVHRQRTKGVVAHCHVRAVHTRIRTRPQLVVLAAYVHPRVLAREKVRLNKRQISESDDVCRAFKEHHRRKTACAAFP
mmetsp:Transcript_15227/g.49993  ORF Transcript_15227/g.49993 Transcript_15227/m.49993 type:complete len:296 (+) Transcript_15227:493-1380(+)